MKTTSARHSRPKATIAAAATRFPAAILAAILLAFATSPASAECGPAAAEVDARCYPGNLQAAVNAAISTDRPLVMPHGTYQGPIVIDYTPRAGTGFELISRGATIQGTLTIQCEGSCFYFHQEGTLFVSADTNGYAVVIGKPDFSDAQNSIKIDHLIVNNGNQGAGSGGVQLNYVLGSDLFIVADSAGGAAGLDLRQLQFSTLKGAGSAASGYAAAIEDGYVIADSLQSLDLEASQSCLLMTSPHAASNVWLNVYEDCPVEGLLSRSALTGNSGMGGVVGGNVLVPYRMTN